MCELSDAAWDVLMPALNRMQQKHEPHLLWRPSGKWSRIILCSGSFPPRDKQNTPKSLRYFHIGAPDLFSWIWSFKKGGQMGLTPILFEFDMQRFFNSGAALCWQNTFHYLESSNTDVDALCKITSIPTYIFPSFGMPRLPRTCIKTNSLSSLIQYISNSPVRIN